MSTPSLLRLLVVGACVPALAAARQGSFTVEGRLPGEQLGAALCRVDDLDGDGGDELAIGAPLGGAAGARPGGVRVVRGRDGAPLALARGRHPRDRFGAALALALDLDGDGAGDLLVGAPQRPGPDDWSSVFRVGDGVGPGYVELRSSRSGALLRSHGPALTAEGFGHALASGADVDGDGEPDYLVGAPAPVGVASEPGDVWLFSGAGGQVIRHHAGTPATGEIGFGSALAFVPDVDGDGVAEYAVGAPGGSTYVAGPGLVTLFSGATGTALWVRTLAGDPGLGLGRGLATCGDVDGDGHVDLLASATGILAEGYACWLSGADGSLLHDVYGLTLACLHGTAPVALWDLGLGSRPGVAFNACEGVFAQIWSADGFVPLVALSPPSGSEPGFGAAIAGGDLDGDGRLDLAVGSPEAGLAGGGRVRVFLGAHP